MENPYAWGSIRRADGRGADYRYRGAGSGRGARESGRPQPGLLIDDDLAEDTLVIDSA